VGLYTRVLERYSSAEGVPLAEILRPDRPVAEALAAVLRDAARRYAAHPDAAGCLAIEGARCNDAEARGAARALTSVRGDAAPVRRHTHPDAAARLAAYVVTVMTGLSAMARQGHGPDRLAETAALAATAIEQGLRDGPADDRRQPRTSLN
jgi:TetR/AcrR family transcriptional repressor for divergent bdcA